MAQTDFTMPPGYVRLPAGVRCKCFHMIVNNGDEYWCCNKGASIDRKAEAQDASAPAAHPTFWLNCAQAAQVLAATPNGRSVIVDKTGTMWLINASMGTYELVRAAGSVPRMEILGDVA